MIELRDHESTLRRRRIPRKGMDDQACSIDTHEVYISYLDEYREDPGDPSYYQ
ncbi:unnamed protein product [Fusarium graminearum]|uniref:Chromosome 3, complete genome n=1 Tax=Gibberella zeae (strain ATCC MYA-4620 / CBS 123657 / FGSC 9075 / NRRL 31084 / PH-1) TaxID=229533 RepID=A0A098E2T6_GIBZE|nr:unnamed protein product [Fusarium graminearum]CZS85363.1 unnamed protein product [Fusarium graminearum]